MTPERWREVETVFQSAMDCDPATRPTFVKDACRNDEDLRREVESLIELSGTRVLVDKPSWEALPKLLSSMATDTLLPEGTELGPYRIEGLLGEGGMGHVYRARDTRLDRPVAIKCSRQEFSERFEREARAVSTLNHPNICTLYDLGPNYLVMELVEGPTLADRIEKGPLPLEEAVSIARQITDALESAHERGVVHRDLKPANIKITSEGVVKVLDFGLAKISATSSNPGNSPALAATQGGMILGTAAYMSPEQARGLPVDKRADIWAFGVVLFEMLTGRPLFQAGSVSDTLASVLTKEPPWPQLPAAFHRLLRRCLQKDARRRLRDIADARLELDELESVTLPGNTKPRPFAWIASAILFVLLVVVGTLAFRRTAPPASAEVRFQIPTPPTADPRSMAISPDGQKLVFAATADRKPQLWLRVLSELQSRPLPGTERASNPFWSPDSRMIGFYSEAQIKVINIIEGSIHKLATGVGGEAFWNSNNVILFGSGLGPIRRISINDTIPVPATPFEGAQQRGHGAPRFLPDGRHFLYYVASSGIHIGELGNLHTRRLMDSESAAQYASGHLFYVRKGTLFAQPFDLDQLGFTGDPISIAQEIASSGAVRMGAITVSPNGTIAYRTGSPGSRRQFVWIDPSGKELSDLGEPMIVTSSTLCLSPDGRQLAFGRVVEGNGDIWLLDTERGGLSRFTSSETHENSPVWSRDGRRILYQSNRTGHPDLYVRAADSTSGEELLLQSPATKLPRDWSPDGRHILFVSASQKTGPDLWALPLFGDRKSFPVVQTKAVDGPGQFSPDGQWILFQSAESGRHEVYVQPFAEPGAKVLISTNGGAQPRWSADGKQIFYIALDDKMMAVPIQLDSSRRRAEPGPPKALFPTHVGGAVQAVNSPWQYQVARDGRFLMRTVTDEFNTSPITVIMNWKPRR